MRINPIFVFAAVLVLLAVSVPSLAAEPAEPLAVTPSVTPDMVGGDDTSTIGLFAAGFVEDCSDPASCGSTDGKSCKILKCGFYFDWELLKPGECSTVSTPCGTGQCCTYYICCDGDYEEPDDEILN